MSSHVRIGTSGWHYKHWVGRFYPDRWPASKMLQYYEEHFDTVEINNSFYRLPVESALEAWRDSTPPNFLFAVKGSRYLTHMKKLKDPDAGIEKFFSRADLLKKKLGPIVFQLPPNFGINPERLETFLDALPKHHRYAFEFRDPSWESKEIYDLLRSRNAAWCAWHLASYESPIEVTADFAYVRLHGPGGKYQGRYTDAALKHWANRIKTWPDTYVYFDNDDSAYAAFNAQRLRQFL